MTEPTIYPGKAFQVDFRNLNLKARSTKDGMHYSLQAEITEEDFDRFRGADLTGSVFTAEIACVEVGQPKEEKVEKPKGGELAKLAGMWCSDTIFWLWLGSIGLRDEGHLNARSVILNVCRINSRSELDHNDEAAKIFHEKIRIPYTKWLQDVGVKDSA